MWHLINPRLEEFVSKKAVGIFLHELAYIAIDMNISNNLSIFNLYRHSPKL
jgi:hypothetical protein